MHPVAQPNAGARSDDPVRRALADEQVLTQLRVQASCLLARRNVSVPAGQRDQVAEELVQETARRALQHGETFDRSRNAAAWLYGILLRVAQDYGRAQQRQPVQQPGDAEDWEQLASRLRHEQSAEKQVAARHDAAHYLARLDEEQRLLVELRLIEGLEFDAIAERMGISAVNARVRMSRLLKELKDRIVSRTEEDGR